MKSNKKTQSHLGKLLKNNPRLQMVINKLHQTSKNLNPNLNGHYKRAEIKQNNFIKSDETHLKFVVANLTLN